jgi:hypothetical protein
MRTGHTGARLHSGAFGAQDFCTLHDRAQLAAGHRAWQVLHATVGRQYDLLRLDLLQGAFDARGHQYRQLHRHVGQIDATDHHLFVNQRCENGAVQVRLRGFYRYLFAVATGKLGQEVVPGRARVDDGRVAKADMHGRGPGHAFQRAVERTNAVLARLLEPRLHIGLVHLHDVRTMREQVLDLLVERGRVIHRRLFLGLVEIVLRLLQHGKRPRHGDLDLACGVGLQKQQVVDLDRPQRLILPTMRGTGLGWPYAPQAAAATCDAYPYWRAGGLFLPEELSRGADGR